MSSLTHVVGSVSEHPRIRSLLEGAGIEISIGRVTTHDPKYKKNTFNQKDQETTSTISK
jgi:hypothetical protein